MSEASGGEQHGADRDADRDVDRDVDHDVELARLRSLVGPSEVSYEALRRDVDEAQRVAREAVEEAGRLRGRIAEMSVQLSRARQDQDVLQRRSEMGPTGRLGDRVVMRWRASVVPRLRRLRSARGE